MTRIILLFLFSIFAFSAPHICFGVTGSSLATAVVPEFALRNVTGKHYATAVELYRGGPGMAELVIKELDRELVEHPESASARLLKARTLKGIGHFDEALAVLDEFAQFTAARGTTSPIAQYLRAECLFYKKDYLRAKTALEPFRRLFEGSALTTKMYDELMSRINDQLASPPEASK